MEKLQRSPLRMTVLVPPDEILTDLLHTHELGNLSGPDLTRILELHFLDQDYTVDQLLEAACVASSLSCPSLLFSNSEDILSSVRSSKAACSAVKFSRACECRASPLR